MYVYITKFEDQPRLIKIGRSINPVSRNASLSKTHGRILYSDHYKVGSEYGYVEKYLHNKYSKYQERVCGDGETEFFSDEIYKDVSNYLSKYNTNEHLYFDRDFIESELKRERKRYHNLIGKLLGYKRSEMHTGEYSSFYTGQWDIVKIEGCCNIGFTLDEICSKYLICEKESTATRFTTTGRISLAYKLAKEGTLKEKTMQSRLNLLDKKNLLH